MNGIEIKEIIRARKLVRLDKFISVAGIVAALTFTLLYVKGINHLVLNIVLGGIVSGSLINYFRLVATTNQMIALLEKQINIDPDALKVFQQKTKTG